MMSHMRAAYHRRRYRLRILSLGGAPGVAICLSVFVFVHAADHLLERNRRRRTATLNPIGT